jgi:Tol biopolymer transport system component
VFAVPAAFSEINGSGLMWTPDGRSLVYVDDQSKLSTLLRISMDGGSDDRETTYPQCRIIQP